MPFEQSLVPVIPPERRAFRLCHPDRAKLFFYVILSERSESKDL